MKKLSVKDFIIDVQEIKEEQKKTVNKSSKYEYKVVLENNTDFVLNKKTKTTNKDLVFLISQGVFYIQNHKNKNIENITEQKLRGFFQPIYSIDFDKFSKVEWWGNNAPEDKIEEMIDIITYPIIQKMYKHNIFENKSTCFKWEKVFNDNNKLFQYCYDKIKNNEINHYYLDNILFVAADIENNINFNNAKYFIDKINENNIIFSIYDNWSRHNYELFISMINKYNLNFNRYIDYVTQDLYSQGLSRFDNDILSLYRDYLDMQISLYGKIKEKYPKYLKTEHDIVTLKFNTYKKYKKDLLVFNVSDRHKNLEYKTKKYSIVLPKTSIDIVDEGINQSHCVGSYVDKVAKNESLILFMRDTQDLEKSLITIEVLDDVVTQIRGFGNRFPTKEEEVFLSKWAKEKQLKYQPDKTILNGNN
ncbi:PcfJ domain-containing protein [Clostridium botulinum]|nr:PcfJ domain-containing protein [Clostridium botulinum]EKS4395756.1 PcfJ domain-containing protein [Clostridium botulinum]